MRDFNPNLKKNVKGKCFGLSKMAEAAGHVIHTLKTPRLKRHPKGRLF